MEEYGASINAPRKALMHLLRIILRVAVVVLIGYAVYSVLCFVLWALSVLAAFALVAVGVIVVFHGLPETWKSKWHEVTGTLPDRRG